MDEKILSQKGNSPDYKLKSLIFFLVKRNIRSKNPRRWDW